MEKDYRLLLKLVVLSIMLLGIIACVDTHSQNNTESMINTDDVNTWQLQKFQSSVEKQNTSSWNTETIQIGKKEDIEKVYFYDKTIGYATTSTSTIYKTSDSGMSWEKISSIGNFTITDLFFITQTEGFATVYNTPSSSLISENSKSRIIKTEDGGRNWKIANSLKSIILEKLAFNSDGVGLAVGVKIILAPQLNQSNVVLFTNDKGQTWIDMSEKFNQIALNKEGVFRGDVADILFTEDKGIIVISSRGSIYNTVDEGKSWHWVDNFIDESLQTRISNLGRLDNGKFLVAGGSTSRDHGTWGIIAVNQKELSWDRYELVKYYFSDVEFLSNNEIIASGSVVEGRYDLKGVILYSSDSGKSWILVHQSQSTSEFTSIAKLSENKLFVAGKNGTGVFLEKIEKDFSKR